MVKAQEASKPVCFCGSSTTYQDSKDYYAGTSYGMRWICDRFPACRGSVGAHPDGRPLGTIPDEETKQLRIKLHALVDPLWRDRTDRTKKRNRASVYGWLRRIMDMTSQECHIGNFTKDQCLEALKKIEEKPYLTKPSSEGGLE